MPAGSGRIERLDPFALPVQFEDADPFADGQVRMVEIHRERLVLRRALRGIKMAISLPSAAYLGVAIRMHPMTAKLSREIAIVLAHRIRRCRSPSHGHAKRTTFLQTGAHGDTRSAYPCWSRAPTGGCASHSSGSGA